MKLINRHAIVSGPAMIALMLPCAKLSAQTGSADASASSASTTAGMSTEENVGAEEIIVTANKREQKLSDVGLTISALSSDDLKANQVRSLIDIAQAVPGLSYANSLTNTPILTLRGVGFYETSLAAYPTTSVYLDEVSLPFPVMTSQTAFDLERIEVLKGPQGTLFGSNSTGGAINYIAAKPTSSLEAGAQLSYERFDRVTAEGYVSGPLTSNLLARIAVRAAHGGDWQKSYISGEVSGKSSYFAARMLLDWTPVDTVRLQLNLNGWQDKSDPQSPVFLVPTVLFPGTDTPLANFPVAPRSNRATDFSTNERPFGRRPESNNRLLQSALRADIDVSDDLTLTSLTSYIDYRHLQAVEGDGTLYVGLDNTISGPLRSFSQEVRLANGQQSAFRWVAGGNFSHDVVTDNNDLRFPEGSVTKFLQPRLGTATFRSKQRMKNYAVFGNAEYEVFPSVTLKGGVRYTENKRNASICQFGGFNTFFTTLSRAVTGDPTIPDILPDECFTLLPNALPSRDPTIRQLNENNLSWQTGVSWKMNPDILAYANVSKGYKAGSYPTLNASAVSQYLAVTQESVLAYELGLKGSFFDRRVSVNAAAFYYDYKDKQIKSKSIDAIFGPVDILTNIPKSVIKGSEIEVSLRPLSGLTLAGAAAYTDAKVKEFVGVSGSGQLADYAGARIPFAPKWRTSVSARYVTPITTALNASFGATYTTQSSAVTVIGGTGIFKIPGYQLLDLQAGIAAADDSWQVTVYGKNIGNKYYLTNVTAATDNILGYTGRPVIYGISLSATF